MKRKKTESGGYKDEMKTSLLYFVTEVGNFIALAATAVLTLSLSIIMDLANSACNLLRTGICSFLSIKLQRNQTFKYNYGTDNLETLSMLMCEILLVVGTGAVMVFAVFKLFHPSQPANNLIIGVLYKLWCVIADGILSYTGWRVYKKTGTKVAKVNFEGCLSAMGFDAAVFLSVLLAFLFRERRFVVYVEPIASILIAVYVMLRAVIHIGEYSRELTYVTLEEADQIKITSILAHHFERFEDFFSVNSRKSGTDVYIDFLISFPQETTYGEIVDTLKDITCELEETFENCKVSIIIDSKHSLTEKAR